MDNQEFEQDFAALQAGFMKPQVFQDFYFEIDTTAGTEIIPSYVCGRTAGIIVEYFLDYLEGKPLDMEETVECKHGWVARMSAPGYMDCTSYTAHNSEEQARRYLVQMYGDE